MNDLPLFFSAYDYRLPLYHLLPNFRHPSVIQKNQTFLIHDPLKYEVVKMLTDGLRGDWGSLPTAGVPVTNFLKCPAARIKCRDRFKNEVEKGRMIGGPG